MIGDDGVPSPTDVAVGIAEIAVADEPIVLKAHGLGSCVAVALHDPAVVAGGLAHVMLPNHGDDEEPPTKPGKYADTAIPRLVDEVVSLGADRDQLRAKLAGGSDMFEFDALGDTIGQRNVATAHRELERRGIPLVGESVGGSDGRTVRFDLATGECSVSTAADGEVKRL